MKKMRKCFIFCNTAILHIAKKTPPGAQSVDEVRKLLPTLSSLLLLKVLLYFKNSIYSPLVIFDVSPVLIILSRILDEPVTTSPVPSVAASLKQ